MPTFMGIPVPSVDVDFEVFCANCGKGLCNKSDASSWRRGFRVDVEPCPDCIKDAEDRGREEKE